MDPYLALGVPRGCSRQEVKAAFRARVRYAHPDRGGEVLLFVQLRTAYEQILAELDQSPGPDTGKRGPDPSDEHSSMTTRSGVAEEPYESWLRHIAAQATSQQSVWGSAPVRTVGMAIVLLLIAVNLVVCWVLWTSEPPLPIAAHPIEPANGGDEADTSPTPIRLAPLPRWARRWQRPPANATDFFLIPYDATLYVAPMVGGPGGATEIGGRATDFGIVLSQTGLLTIFIGLPGHPNPARELEVGPVSAGSKLRVYLKRGNSWVFSDSGFTESSRETFSDRDNSLGGGGSIIEKTGSNTWVLHLDDVGSYDDDDDDIFIQIRLKPTGD
jgi:hypothetical protein